MAGDGGLESVKIHAARLLLCLVLMMINTMKTEKGGN
jgi:hypothetical protein